MIKFEEVYNIAKQAFLCNEMYDFLSGKNGYDLPVLDSSTNIPTDWTVIIPNGIYVLYKNSEEKEKVKNDFFVAIRKMLDGDSTEIWKVAYILFVLLKNQYKNNAPFTVDDSLVELFRNKVMTNKVQLSKNKKYEGEQFSDGLYGDIVRLNNILESKYFVKMI